MSDIRRSAEHYEAWLQKQLHGELVKKDLRKKHEKMGQDPFVFLRATYWRWAETVLDVCPELGQAPRVLAVGDIHLENFGTWRDAEARLDDDGEGGVGDVGEELGIVARAAVVEVVLVLETDDELVDEGHAQA